MYSVNNLNYPQLDRLRRSLEDTIRETNRVSAKWVEDITSKKNKHIIITNDDIKSVFNGFFKKMLKHYLLDDIEIKRFLSWNKPHVRVNVETLQIIGLSFLRMRDFDHPFLQSLTKIVNEIPFTSLQVVTLKSPVSQNEDNLALINFESIENIKF
jgi:hypothetical protein